MCDIKRKIEFERSSSKISGAKRFGNLLWKRKKSRFPVTEGNQGEYSNWNRSKSNQSLTKRGFTQLSNSSFYFDPFLQKDV